MKTLQDLRAQYDEICEVRLAELDYPEEYKTLKTETFLAMERKLVFMCAEEKLKLGIIPALDIPGNSYGMSYGKRKNGSWQRKGRCAFLK